MPEPLPRIFRHPFTTIADPTTAPSAMDAISWRFRCFYAKAHDDGQICLRFDACHLWAHIARLASAAPVIPVIET